MVEREARRIRIGGVERPVALLGDVELGAEREPQALEPAEPRAEIVLASASRRAPSARAARAHGASRRAGSSRRAARTRRSRVVVDVRGREQPVQRRLLGVERLAELAGERGEDVALFRRQADAKRPVALRVDSASDTGHSRQSCCIVAQRPCAWRRETSSSAFSCVPDDTTALPSLCTWSMSVVAWLRE